MGDFLDRKESFIDKQTSIDSRIIEFDEQFDSWISALPTEMVPIALELLDKFDYYSHETANQMLQDLHVCLMKELDCEESDPVYTYIKKKNGMLCSSVDYWFEYRFLNNVSKSLFSDDINLLSQNSWDLIEYIVIIDDCCGTGGSLEKYLKTINRSLEGKTIYYIVLHFLNDAETKLKELEALYDITIRVLYVNVRSKACDMVFGDKSQEIRNLIEDSASVLLIDKDYALGKDKSEGLMAFHNNTPNNTIGLFWYKSESNNPIFPREKKTKPSWRGIDTLKKEKYNRKKNNYIAMRKKYNG